MRINNYREPKPDEGTDPNVSVDTQNLNTSKNASQKHPSQPNTARDQSVHHMDM